MGTTLSQEKWRHGDLGLWAGDPSGQSILLSQAPATFTGVRGHTVPFRQSVWGHVAHGPGPGEVTSALRPGGRAAPGRGRGAWRPRGSGGLAGLRRAERAGGVTCESLFLPCGLQLPRGLKRRRRSAYGDAGTGEDLGEEVGAGGRPRTSDGLPERSPSW